MGQSEPVLVDESAPPGARYLFLQGPNGPFFSQLARRLMSADTGIFRINLNGGDSVFWSVPGALTLDYRGDESQWADFVGVRLYEWQITDLVLFGDCRPLHREAIRIAGLLGLRVHVFEEGYLRPHWVTLEAGGVNRHSSLPRDPGWFLRTAALLPPAAAVQPVVGNFVRRAAEDVLYTLSLAALSWRFPGYRTHKPWHPLVEYRAGARRFPGRARVRRRAAATVARLLAEPQPYFLFPLQLHSDAQIRFHSPFGDMGRAIETVVHSFARHAPPEARLVLTEHPLDNGVIDLKGIAQRAAQQQGMAGRLFFVEGGSPCQLLQRARALVTVNSTIGLLALGYGLPVAALGEAIYAMPGLVHGGDLAGFWQQPQSPDALLFQAFQHVVLHHTQINGGFYTVEGRRLAVEGAAQRLRKAVREPVFAAPCAVTAGPADWVRSLGAELGA